MFDDPRWLPLFRLALRTLDLPRRYLPEVPWLSEFVALPDSQLEIGQEFEPPGERELIHKVIEVLEERHRREYPAGVRPMLRDFHTKAHGCVLAKLKIEPDLPSEYRYGVFANPAEYDAVLRFSNGQRPIQADQMPTPHGVAIKLFEVPDPARPNHRVTQDFLLADFPVNLIGTVADAFEFYQAEAAGKPQAYFISPLPLRHHLRAGLIGYLSAETPVHDLFDISYFSQTPYKLGAGNACKYILRPTITPTPNRGQLPAGDNYLREQMQRRLLASSVSFDFLVQRQLHPVRQPIEDASVEWREDEAPPRKVATVVLERYDFERPFTSPWRQWCCERISYNPGTTLPDSAPLGGLNRLRHAVYDQISIMRHRANGVIRREPNNPDDFVSKTGW